MNLPKEAGADGLPLYTPEGLMADNQSKSANRRLEEYQKRRTKGKLNLIMSDGHPLIDPYAMFNDPAVTLNFRSTAPEPFAYLLNHKSVQGITVLTTADINENIEQPWNNRDSTIEAIQVAQKVSRNTNKSVVAAVIDPYTYDTYPLAAFWQKEYNGKLISLSDSSIHSYYWDHPDELDLKEFEQIPGMNPDYFYQWVEGRFFGDMLKTRFRAAKQLGDPEIFADEQRQRRAKTIFFTTVPVNPSLRYPAHFREPGLFVALHAPFVKTAQEETEVKGEVKDIDWSNLRYTQSELMTLLNRAGQSDDINDPLGSLQYLILETPRQKLTKELFDELIKNPAVGSWLHSVGGKILLAEVKRGRTQAIYTINESNFWDIKESQGDWRLPQ